MPPSAGTALQKLVVQSVPTLQCLPHGHAGHVPPPQSTSVSFPSSVPFAHGLTVPEELELLEEELLEEELLELELDALLELVLDAPELEDLLEVVLDKLLELVLDGTELDMLLEVVPDELPKLVLDVLLDVVLDKLELSALLELVVGSLEVPLAVVARVVLEWCDAPPVPVSDREDDVCCLVPPVPPSDSERLEANVAPPLPPTSKLPTRLVQPLAVAKRRNSAKCLVCIRSSLGTPMVPGPRTGAIPVFAGLALGAVMTSTAPAAARTPPAAKPTVETIPRVLYPLTSFR